MRIVLDTNVFVAGVFFSGPPYQILSAWRDGRIELLLSPEILDEYERVGAILAGQFGEVDLGPIIDLVAIDAQLVLPSPLPEKVCEDPDDDKFLACAIAAEAPIIVTGDKHLLRVTGYRSIEIMTPRMFLDDHLARDGNS